MKRKLLTLVAAVGVLAAALSGASATDAAPKPGLPPGTWTGIGTLSGASRDGIMSTAHSGQVRFTLVVQPDRSVTGSGTWKRTMTGSGADTKTVIIGTASLKFSGPSREAGFAGKEYAQGKMIASGVTRRIGMPPQKLEGTLVIARAGDCTANGTADIPTRPGLKLKWTAKRSIKGTCNA
jgi:hypothetical protein